MTCNDFSLYNYIAIHTSLIPGPFFYVLDSVLAQVLGAIFQNYLKVSLLLLQLCALNLRQDVCVTRSLVATQAFSVHYARKVFMVIIIFIVGNYLAFIIYQLIVYLL